MIKSELLQALQCAEEDIQAGRTELLTAQLLDDIFQSGIEKSNNGELVTRKGVTP